ncbi:hypothetical protein ACEPPN_014107 [Leptodophora sp. 'Broadleaf-Isolate-01']
MATQKTKVVSLFECECADKDHDTQRQCNHYAKQRVARSITTKILLMFSKTASIVVGPERQIFNLHQDLLALHSVFFREHFAFADQNIILPSVNVAEFADFVAWVYGEDSSHLENDRIENNDETVLERGWALGSFLGSPGYQNVSFSHYSEYCPGDASQWPDLKSIRIIYERTLTGSKLRKFAAHSMAANPPFKKHKPGSQEFAEWNALLKEYPVLNIDIVHATAKDWGETFPWDDEHLGAYLEDETPLDQAWEEQILAKRDIAAIKGGAKKKCIRSIFELAHLERKKN